MLREFSLTDFSDRSVFQAYGFSSANASGARVEVAPPSGLPATFAAWYEREWTRREWTRREKGRG